MAEPIPEREPPRTFLESVDYAEEKRAERLERLRRMEFAPQSEIDAECDNIGRNFRTTGRRWPVRLLRWMFLEPR